MKIVELFKKKKPVVAFEIFPPKPHIPVETIFDSLDQFKSLNPDYISVTYGAGGSQKGRTVEIASKIKNEYGIESMAHLTCVGHSEAEIDSLLDSLHSNNIENILALRGDPPKDQPNFDYSKNAFKYANELIGHIKSNKHDFGIGAAVYVEGHVQSKRIQTDMLYLKQKFDTGVDFLVSQLFFDNRWFYDFLDKAGTLGINCPVMPGIIPVSKADQIKSMALMCGVSIPAKLVIMIEKYADNSEDLKKAGIEYASEQIRDLLDSGVDGIHIFTMNKPDVTREIMENTGLI